MLAPGSFASVEAVGLPAIVNINGLVRPSLIRLRPEPFGAHH